MSALREQVPSLSETGTLQAMRLPSSPTETVLPPLPTLSTGQPLLSHHEG
jgi:hypothetical protein